MKNTSSLKSKMIMAMVILVILQSIGILTIAIFSNALNILDGYAFRFFDGYAENQIRVFNNEMGILVEDVAKKTEIINKRVLFNFTDETLSDEEKYENAMIDSSGVLIELLRSHKINGAFFIIDEEALADMGIDSVYANPAVYMRVSDSNIHNFNLEKVFLLEGPNSVLKMFRIASSTSLNNYYLSAEKTKQEDFYRKTMEAARKMPFAELTRYGYWSSPMRLLPTTSEVVTYTLPLINKDGNVFGIVGIDISKRALGNEYLFTNSLPYKNGFYIATMLNHDEVSTKGIIAQTPYGERKIKNNPNLKLYETYYPGIYEAGFKDGSKMFCTVRQLRMYSNNSPYYNETWSIIGFVEKNALQSDSNKVRVALILGVIVLITLSFVVVLVISYLSTNKMARLEKEIDELSPLEPVKFASTGIKEIDTLTEKIQLFSAEILQAHSLTTTLIDLSLLPVGIYEIKRDFDIVKITPFIGKLLNLGETTTSMTVEEWETKSANLLKKKFPKENDNIYEYYDKTKGNLYLRIREKQKPNEVFGVVVDVTPEIREQVRLNTLLDHDSLTGLYNRRAIESKALQTIFINPRKVGAMLFADLDNLKYVNDTYGHEIGDLLIKRAANIFREFKRYGALIARISGDEFAIYMHGFNNKDEIRAILEENIVNADLKYIQMADDEKLGIRFSVGVAYYPEDSKDVKELLKFSDFAMYVAKKNEKGSLAEFEKSKYFEQKYLLENRENINTLLLYEQIRFAFQPIADMRTGEIYAYEALMRSTTENFKNPFEILSVAKMQGKLKNLERLIFKLIFKAIYEKQEEIGEAKVFINSIPKYMISVPEINKIMDKYPIDLRKIVIEVIESEADGLGKLNEKLEEMKNAGIELAIDDYGSGFSSEVRLLHINPEIIKMDINLISNIDRDERKQKLLADLIAFCLPYNIKVLGEGIETQDELRALINYDVALGQGYYLAKPDFEIKKEIDVKDEIINFNKQKITQPDFV